MNTIIIIEDCRYTGSILAKYLHENELARLVSDRGSSTGLRTRGVATNRSSKDRHYSARHELGHGQLHQLADVLIDYDRDLDEDGLSFPEVVVFPPERAALALLGEWVREEPRAARQANLLERLRSLELRKGQRQRDVDDLVIVADLALLPNEGRSMERCGAVIESALLQPETIRDPRRTLRNLTGFRVLETLWDVVPVIVTSYSNNPLVAHHCLVSGAVGVVRKPVPPVDRRPGTTQSFDMKTAGDRSIATLENNARKYSKQAPALLDVLVVHYASTLTAEVLKAIAVKSAKYR